MDSWLTWVLPDRWVGGSGYAAVRGIGVPRSSKARRWSGVGSASGVSLAAERIWSVTERGSCATSGARHLDDRVDQALRLTLVTNAAVLWTATYLGDALDAPQRT